MKTHMRSVHLVSASWLIPILLMLAACSSDEPEAPVALEEGAVVEAAPDRPLTERELQDRADAERARRHPSMAPQPGKRWHLVAANSEGLAETAGNARVTLETQAARLIGFGGCNRYSVELAEENGELKVGDVAATKRGCPGARGEIEAAFFSALRAAEGFREEGKQLVLRTRFGEELRFDSGAPPPGSGH